MEMGSTQGERSMLEALEPGRQAGTGLTDEENSILADMNHILSHIETLEEAARVARAVEFDQIRAVVEQLEQVAAAARAVERDLSQGAFEHESAQRRDCSPRPRPARHDPPRARRGARCSRQERVATARSRSPQIAVTGPERATRPAGRRQVKRLPSAKRCDGRVDERRSGQTSRDERRFRGC